MSYSYISLHDLHMMQKKNREAIVIFDVQTKDIEEYVNNCIITLGNDGFNTNLLINPKILSGTKMGNGNRIVIIPMRYNIKLDANDSNILKIWAEQMGNVCNLKQFFENNYRNKVEADKAKELANTIDSYTYIKYIALDMKIKKQVKECISLKDINRYIGKYDKNNIENYITNIVSYLFKHKNKFVYTLILCKNKISEDIKINVQPTADSIKLTYSNQ